MRRSADVGEKVGSNGRLLPQPMSVPDPLRKSNFLRTGHSWSHTSIANRSAQTVFC